MRCPYCYSHFKIGPLVCYKTREEKKASKESRQTYLCTCTHAQGFRWNHLGEVTGEPVFEKETKPLDAIIK